MRPCIATVPLVSLQQAISRLGLTTLREIVITVSMQSRIFNIPSYATEARALWQHAVIPQPMPAPSPGGARAMWKAPS